MKKRKTQQRAEHRSTKPILVRFPHALIPLIDRAVEVEDLDRSKFIRHAVREKLERSGLGAPTAA